MKNKFLLGIAAGLFTVATMVSFNMSNTSGSCEVSLDDVAVMAQAQDDESGPKQNNQRFRTTASKQITTYYKWDVKAQIWIITLNIGEAGRTEVTSYSYPCCVIDLSAHCDAGVDC